MGLRIWFEILIGNLICSSGFEVVFEDLIPNFDLKILLEFRYFFMPLATGVHFLARPLTAVDRNLKAL